MSKSKNNPKSFFSISSNSVRTEAAIPYDIYINSSGVDGKEHFVKIKAKGDHLSTGELNNFVTKYYQFYLSESQRNLYIASLVDSKNLSESKKVELIKDSAIHHLERIFDDEKIFSTELLTSVVEGCRESVNAMVKVIKDNHIDELRTLISNLSFHDFYTYDHSVNVSMYCISILRMVKPKASDEELIQIGLGGMLHDLGKTMIPTKILNKPGKLTNSEFDEIKNHPTYGLELLDKYKVCCQGVDLQLVNKVIHEHHENYNGTGYPASISGKQIHQFSRIATIADFFDAITTKRSYHDVLSTEEAISLMEKSVGKKIDPKLFKIFKEKSIDVVNTVKSSKSLPDDFDPCQPHDVLPLTKEKSDLFQDAQNSYGKVIKKKAS